MLKSFISLFMDSTTLTLHRSKAQITLECPKSLCARVSLDTIRQFPPFVQWLAALDTQMLQTQPNNQVVVSKITVQSIDEFHSGKIGFLKFSALATHQAEQKQVPGIVFLRGGSVAMLVILRTQQAGAANQQRVPSHRDSSYVLLTEQPRIAAPDFGMVELPAGMLDDDTGEFSGAAAREIHEETGLSIKPDELIDLTPSRPSTSRPGFFPSVGACDERIHFFACEKHVSEEELVKLRGKLGGLRDDGEIITLRLVRMCDLWKETCDMKALTALYLWDQWTRQQKSM
ncbi:hypothetical protein IWW36_001623 [Coemansia brasiliensis]|uniref:Nudix hydrolase domain-containing protein n=1 Tax=Coemansia brasiliensis TaxID=2650707 RepID=A0A9W8IGE2_9FUNG|nr:hypothetical protein IWW36_001623 [Coemansia brasiliensis]